MNNQNNSINQNTNNTVKQPQSYSKPLFDLQKGDITFALCAVLASIFTVTFGVFGGFALGYMLSVILTVILFFAYSVKCRGKGLFGIICGVMSLGCSTVFICTSNFFVRFFGVIICFLLCLMCFDGNTIGKTQGNRSTLMVFVRAICSVVNLDITVKSLFSSGDDNKKGLGKVLIGIVCAIPVLVVIIPLLISSDAAFKGMMLKLFSNSFTTIIKIIIGIAVSIFVISYGFSLKKGYTYERKGINFGGIENVYVISFLSAITLCYLLYLFSQLAYFFSAFRGFLPQNYSYADYARKGFFEMCVISIINLSLVLLSLILAKKNCGRVCVALKIITTFISVFTLLIIATAISKMVLYIGEYGMTVLRLGTSIFMMFLSVLFIALVFKIYLPAINIVKTALVTAGVTVMLLGTLNINAVCAEYNYESYKSGKLNSIDVYALYDLGDEGVPYLVRLAASDDYSVSKTAKNCLAWCYWDDYFDNMENKEQFTVKQLKANRKSTGFAYYSTPRERAYNWLYKFVKDNPDFDEWCYRHFAAQEQAQSGTDWF